MALIDRLGLDRAAFRRVTRRGLARGLRVVADTLRDVSGVDPGPIVVGRPAPAPGEPVDRGERHGAAAWVDAQQAARPVEPAPAPAAEPAEPAQPASVDPAALHDRVIDVLHTVYDPEIPVDVYELGLIYGVEVRDDRGVHVRMTLTSPNCPAAQSLPVEIEEKVAGIDGVVGVDVEVVFDPPWTPDLMSEEAKLELNIL